MSDTKIDYSKHIYTPLETAKAGYDEAERIQNHTKTGIDMPFVHGCDLSSYFARVMPWEIVMVIGQSHNGKTLFSDWWENGMCEQLKAEKRDDEVVVHVSVEESLEAMSFQQHSKFSGIPVGDIASGIADLAKLRISTNQIAGVNIFRIADSALVEDDAPPLTLSNIYRILKALKNGDVTGTPTKIAAVWVDYLQALPIDDEVKRESYEKQRRLQVRSDVFRMRRMTVHLGAPVFCNVQAKQELGHPRHPFYIPTIYDGEETAAIAQRPDRILGVWMPKVSSFKVGENVSGIGVITEEMFYVRVNKQRGGFPSGKVFPLQWDYQKRTLSSLHRSLP